jgi:hypothetical protein
MPSTTVALLISGFFLVVTGVLSILGFSELIPPAQLRWVVCGMDLFLAFCYFLWIIYILVSIQRSIKKGKYSSSSSTKAKKHYATAIELQHVMISFFTIALISIIWASVMGAQPDSQFLPLTNGPNYLILKVFYAINFATCVLCVSYLFNFPADYLQLKLSN